jgi:hypothetical protein
MLLHRFLHWFIIIGHGLYCFALCFTSSPFLYMCCIVSLFSSHALPYWAWFVLFYFMLHCFIINGHFCIVSLP